MKRAWKRIAVVVACAALLIVGLAACSSGGGSKDFKDAYDREVALPDNVEKVATVGSGARFVVYAGGQDKLIAVTDMETSPSPARPYTVAYADLFAPLPSTSNGNHLMETEVDAERLMELAPDLIISSRSAEECDALQEQTGIPVVGISYQNQLFSDDVYNSIQVVGKALGTEEHANAVVDAMKGWQADLEKRGAEGAKAAGDANPTVYVGAVNFKGAKSFGGTYVGYAPIDALGATNVADALDAKPGSIEVDLEQIAAWNADYMFLNAGNMDLMKKDYADHKALFDGMKAFQNGNLYSQPSFNYNGTNVEMGICDAYFIGSTIYPEAFADVDMDAMYEEVFSTMLGKEYLATMRASGMDFKKLSFS